MIVTVLASPDPSQEGFRCALPIVTAERRTILMAIRAEEPDAAVYPFGSRVNDATRGGDIDLLVLSKKINLMAKLEILAKLHEELGDQRIDLGTRCLH